MLCPNTRQLASIPRLNSSIRNIMSQLPTSTKVITVRESPKDRKPRYHDAALEHRAVPSLQKGQVLVKIGAAAFNHRDVWIRKGMYPGISFGSVFGADGAGTVVASADANDTLLNKRVFLVPMRGWESNPDAPESPKFAILGGGSIVPIGTFSEYVAVERDQVIPTPDYLDDEHAAAWPLGGVTAWRASIVNARASKGDNILITGIGGSVALLALQLCFARGANVYVSSSSQEKISSAVALGAKGGVNYKSTDWPVQLEKLLKRDSPRMPLLSAVIDSAGGDLMGKVNKILKPGGRMVVYGMTAAPAVTFTMREVLKNQQLIGSTMGSHRDLIDATHFIAEHRIVPVVSDVLDGLESAEAGFELLNKGHQFGKVVIRVRHGEGTVDNARL